MPGTAGSAVSPAERDELKSESTAARTWVGRGLLAAIVALTACERSPGPETEQPALTLHGASLVVGTSADQWSLLGVPRDGGLAEARDLTDPRRIVWTGTTELPASVEARVLPGGRLILVTAAGAVHTYDPPSDALVRVGEVAPDAEWMGDASVGLYLSPGGKLLEVSREGVWSYSLDRDVLWAAPAEDGVLVLLDGDSESRELWLLRRDGDQPAETGTESVRPPGVVTAWGRRAVLESVDGRGLVVLTVAPIERAGDIDLEAPILALSPSPSTHEVYVALEDPPRLSAVNRFDLSTRVLADLPGPVTSIRPSLFGESVLMEQDGRVWQVPVGGGSPVAIEAEWREDLPVGLPDGRVLAATAEQVFVADVRAGATVEIDDAGVDRWWLPVHWNPAHTTVTADRLTGEAAGREAPPAVVPEPPESKIDSVVLAERMAAAAGLQDQHAASPESGPPAGFYAIVGSARQAEGIRSLTQSLEDAGFATQVQQFPDEAGRTWYRGLVGPYRSRSEAEAAARQLLRERRLEAWVTEVGAGDRQDGESI